MSMRDRTILQGETTSWVGEFFDENGSPVDFTIGARTAKLRLRNRKTGVVAEKVTSTSADWTWTSQGTGRGYWTFSTTETLALAEGEYDADVVFYDTSTSPATRRRVGVATFEVRAPSVAAL